MKKNILGIIGVFLLNNIMEVLAAKFILAPTLNESFGNTLRPINSLEFPSLTGGYLVLYIRQIQTIKLLNFYSMKLKE